MTVKNITELLNAKKYAQIKKELNEMNSVDLAELLEQFSQESMVIPFPSDCQGNGGGGVHQHEHGEGSGADQHVYGKRVERYL